MRVPLWRTYSAFLSGLLLVLLPFLGLAQVSSQDSLMKVRLKNEVKADKLAGDSATLKGNPSLKPDSNTIGATLPDKPDSLGKEAKPKKKKGDIKTSVKYSCADSMRFDADRRTFFLYKDSKIDYGDISLKADKIDVNWVTNVVNSSGTPDTAGKMRGIPVFTQGKEKYVSQRIKYNFKTKKGLISDVVTQQGEGYLHGETVKKNPDNNMYVKNAQYTTCNLAHPHFYISAPKLKMVPGDRLISGPFNMVFGDVPTPLGFAFGVFPTPKKQTAGIIVPVYGEATDRGFYLRNGGYYFPVGDYASVKLLGDIYTKGSYGFNVLTNYKLRYKYTGNLNVRYSKQKVGQEGFENILENYWLEWSHTPQSYGSSKFQASVNMGSSGYNARNSYSTQNYLSSTFNSSVSYYKTFVGTPFTMSVAASQSQNVTTGVANYKLPDVSLNMNRLYPFKGKGGGKSWYKQLSFSYSANASNTFTNDKRGATVAPGGARSYDAYNAAGDTVLGFSKQNFIEVLRRSKNGIRHSIPISTTVTAFRFFNISPSFTYTETWYMQRYKYTYMPNEYAVNVDTLNQFSRFYNYSASAGVTTRLYGTFFVRKGRLEAIRHTLIPSVSYGYTPDFSSKQFGFYQTLETEKLAGHSAKTVQVSPYQGIFGSPTQGRSSAMSFSLTNQLEAKVRAKDDTAKPKEGEDAPKKKFEKKTLLDQLSIGSSYNFLADSFKLANISLAARTKLFNKFDINMGGVIDPYQHIHTPGNLENVTDPGRRINKYAWENGNFSLGRLTQFNINFSTSFNPKAAKKRNAQVQNALAAVPGNQMPFMNYNQAQYIDWNIPWNLSLQYNLGYSRPGLAAGTRTQSANFNGDVSLTPNWKIGASSSYDLERHGFGYTNMNIYRNIHCWEMRFNWIPFGQRQSYSLDIAVKASVLQDLKLSRRNSWYDR